MPIFKYIIILQDFHNTQAKLNSGGPRNEYLGYNYNVVEMAGDKYLLNMTLCWVINVVHGYLYHIIVVSLFTLCLQNKV